MTDAIKNAVALILFCAPIAAALTWLAWWCSESRLFVLLFRVFVSSIWVVGYLSERTAESRFRQSAQGDKWSFCLPAGKIGPRIRREHEQETAPEPHIGL